MMGRQDRDQGQLFYEFSLDEMIPTDHLLRRINVFATAGRWRSGLRLVHRRFDTLDLREAKAMLEELSGELA
jgi:hypothetical protein